MAQNPEIVVQKYGRKFAVDINDDGTLLLEDLAELLSVPPSDIEGLMEEDTNIIRPPKKGGKFIVKASKTYILCLRNGVANAAATSTQFIDYVLPDDAPQKQPPLRPKKASVHLSHPVNSTATNVKKTEELSVPSSEPSIKKTATPGEDDADLKLKARREEALKRLEQNRNKKEASAKALQDAVNRSRKLQTESLDLVFLMDATGSMDPYLKAASEKAVEISEWIKHEYPEMKTRFGFVAYRDHGDKKQFEVSALHASAERIRDFAGSLVADGGADGPEDVVGGFERALKLEWAASTRLIVWIADAPCHDRRFHDMYDSYPNGYPGQRSPEEILEDIKQLNINIVFGKITEDTEKMIQTFKSFYDTDHRMLIQLRIGDTPKDFLDFIMETVRSTVTNGNSHKARAAAASAYSAFNPSPSSISQPASSVPFAPSSFTPSQPDSFSLGTPVAPSKSVSSPPITFSLASSQLSSPAPSTSSSSAPSNPSSSVSSSSGSSSAKSSSFAASLAFFLELSKKK